VIGDETGASSVVPAEDLDGVEAVAWGYVGVGQTGRHTLRVSDDLVGWREAVLPVRPGPLLFVDSVTDWRDFAVAAVAYQAEDGQGIDTQLLVSQDGETWTVLAGPDAALVYGVTSVGDELVVLTALADGTPDAVLVSRDGVSWEPWPNASDAIDPNQGPGGFFDATGGRLGIVVTSGRGSVTTTVVERSGAKQVITQDDLRVDFTPRGIDTGPGQVLAIAQPFPTGEIGPTGGVTLAFTEDGWIETEADTPPLSGVTYDDTRWVAVGRDTNQLPGVWESPLTPIEWDRIAGGPLTLTETMPAIVGKTWYAVESIWALDGNYDVGLVPLPSDQGSGGMIVATDPVEGAPLTYGQEITVTVTEVSTTPSGSPPWADPPFDPDAVPAQVVQGWVPEYQECPALSLTPQQDGATPRLGGFGSTVSYDRSSGPGSRGDSSPCTDCGRSAYGVPFGSIFDTRDRMPDWAQYPQYRFDWEDDSFAIIPQPRNDGPWHGIDPETGQPATKHVAVIWLANDCAYGIWSWIDTDHLLGLINDLRYVTTLGAPTS
jgi:hypothetical protein